MKIFTTIFCAALLASSSSYATGVFIGVDALHGNAKHTAKNPSTTTGAQNGDVQKSNNFNYGVNAGVRLDVLNLLASAEIFYDNLNTSSKSFASNQANSGKINIDNRCGAKVNLGFAIFPRVTPFITYGLANVRYGSNFAAANASDSKLVPLYGVGLLVDLPAGFSVKAAYDYQQFNTHLADGTSKVNNHLGVARVGLVYNF